MNVALLKSIMLSVAQARSVEPILEEIVRGVASSVDVALVRIWLLEEGAECAVCTERGESGSGSRELHLVASAGESKTSDENYDSIRGESHRVALGERKIGRIAESGEAMLIPDVSPQQDWVADPQWVEREEIRSFFAQPLTCRNEVLGVLAVFNRTKLTEEEVSWLRTFADHAAVAIWNAKAFEELNLLRRQLELENEYLHDEVKQALQFGDIVGASGALRKVLEQVELVASTDSTVLILGESGTGKELIARAIHERSPRRGHPLIKVNCGAVPQELFESEFFGHVKGAFTGAIKDRTGRFELADGGDILLDEIGEIPLSLQAKLLRVLQEKQFERVGDTKTRMVNARVIAATNRDLREEVRLGRFREDLYYRLTVFPIEVPPLRDRAADIPLLAKHFMEQSARRLNMPVPKLTRAHAEQLAGYKWPGNVRELENVVERAMILGRNGKPLQFDLPKKSGKPSLKSPVAAIRPAPRVVIRTREQLWEEERRNVLAALEQTNGKVFGPGGAAELLGMRPTTLASRLRALGLQKRYVAQEDRNE
jgi:transcriptional regulator with GAF, ATPase, and Fis domain